MRSLLTGVFLTAAIFGLQACSTTDESTTVKEEPTSEVAVQQNPVAQIKNITAAEFDGIKTDKKAIVIDVRTPGEVASGYIAGTTHFIDVNGANFQSEMAKLDKSAEYIVYCRSGARSMNASSYMVQNGFKNVYNLQGGIMQWTGEITK